MKTTLLFALVATLCFPGCQGAPRVPEQFEPTFEDAEESSSLGQESAGFLSQQSEPDPE